MAAHQLSPICKFLKFGLILMQKEGNGDKMPHLNPSSHMSLPFNLTLAGLEGN